jgi:hypothetical protein
MSANECLILDDDELEATQVQQEEKINPRDMRSWLPETMRHTNPFNSNYVSTSHAFPKVFQMKVALKEDFPKLSERTAPIPQTTMNYRSRLLAKPDLPKVSTINVLERVREVLQKEEGNSKDMSGNTLITCRNCSEHHWTLSCPNTKEQEEDQVYSPHTPPYPSDSPVVHMIPPYPNRSPPFIINTPPINQMIYPIGHLLQPVAPSSTPSYDGLRKEHTLE